MLNDQRFFVTSRSGGDGGGGGGGIERANRINMDWEDPA
jgi:hypothetical protein